MARRGNDLRLVLEQPLEVGRIHDGLFRCGAQAINGLVGEHEGCRLLVQVLEFSLVL